jgi:hypothetical protein
MPLDSRMELGAPATTSTSRWLSSFAASSLDPSGALSSKRLNAAGFRQRDKPHGEYPGFIAVGLLVGGVHRWFYRLVAGIVVVTPLLLFTGRLSFLTQEVALRDANNARVSARSRVQIVSQAPERLRHLRGWA